MTINRREMDEGTWETYLLEPGSRAHLFIQRASLFVLASDS